MLTPPNSVVIRGRPPASLQMIDVIIRSNKICTKIKTNKNNNKGPKNPYVQELEII